MSDEQNKDSADLPTTNGKQQQAESVTRQAEIIHEDGRRENVQLKAERFWSGALPRPEDFSKYAEVVPDAPERILQMAEREQAHRIAMESQLVPAETAAGARGQWLGAFLSIIALGSAVLLHWLGAPWQLSAACLSVPVFSVARSLVSAFKSDAE